MTGLWVLLAVSFICGLLWHAGCARAGWATLGASLCSVLAFQLLAWWHLGHVDPLALVAAAVSLPVAAVMALLAGWLWRSWRRKRPPPSNRTTP